MSVPPGVRCRVRTRTLGCTGIALTELGFGGAALGNLLQAVDDETAAQSVVAAFAAGVRYFDTAPHYGLGLSERRLGAALSGADRAGFVLSTKVGRLLEANPAPTGSDLAAGGFAVPDDLRRRFDFSADGVRRSLESSLERLGLDRVDIVYLHDPDNHLDQAIAEAIPALVAWREQGVVGAIGVGMNECRGPLRFVRETPVDVVMLAGRWTLLDRSGAELLRECERRGVGVVAAAPYNSGLLARRRPRPDSTFNYGVADRELIDRAVGLAETCERYGVTLPAAAVQFPLRHPAVVSVVAGTRNAAEVEDAVNRWATPIPGPLWCELDA
jgi:D-threo-aldose 1-dehydrogenase